jgi:metal-sulfur cluster biosynthetic enzyme
MNVPTKLDEHQLLDALRQVIDPEIGCNIVDLGLIYGITISGAKVTVQMTLTTPGCPMGESIAQGAQWTLLGIPGVEAAIVEIVWDPPWHPSLMTEIGRAAVEHR